MNAFRNSFFVVDTPDKGEFGMSFGTLFVLLTKSVITFLKLVDACVCVCVHARNYVFSLADCKCVCVCMYVCGFWFSGLEWARGNSK